MLGTAPHPGPPRTPVRPAPRAPQERQGTAPLRGLDQCIVQTRRAQLPEGGHSQRSLGAEREPPPVSQPCAQPRLDFSPSECAGLDARRCPAAYGVPSRRRTRPSGDLGSPSASPASVSPTVQPPPATRREEPRTAPPQAHGQPMGCRHPGVCPPGAAAGGSGAGPEVWGGGGVGVEVGAPGRGFRAGHPRQPPALPGRAGRSRGGACRGGAAGTGEAGGAGHGQGTRRPHGGGSGRRGRRRPLAPGPVPPPSARSPDGPAGGGPGPRCPGAGGRARGSTGRASAPRDPERPRTGEGPGPAAHARDGGAGRGRSLWLVRRNLGPRGRPLLRLPPSTGACPEPRPPRLSLGAVWRSRPGPQRHGSSGCFAGRKAHQAGRGAPSPQRGRVWASPTGERFPRFPGFPEARYPEAPAD